MTVHVNGNEKYASNRLREILNEKRFGGKPNQKAEVVLLTPELAEEWLAHNTKNRALNMRHAKKIAAQIVAGEWMLTGETIVFGKSGRLLDGQHRLMACILAEMSIEVWVIRGADDEAFNVSGQHMPRKASDVLKIDGHKYAHVLATIASYYHKHTNGGIDKQSGSPSHTICRQIVDENPDLQEAAAIGVTFSKITSRYVVGFCYFVFARQNATLAKEFFSKLKDGHGLAADDPAWALRERLLCLRGDKKSTTETEYLVALFFKAWNAAKARKPLKSVGLKHGPKDKFPSID